MHYIIRLTRSCVNISIIKLYVGACFLLIWNNKYVNLNFFMYRSYRGNFYFILFFIYIFFGGALAFMAKRCKFLHVSTSAYSDYVKHLSSNIPFVNFYSFLKISVWNCVENNVLTFILIIICVAIFLYMYECMVSLCNPDWFPL